MKMNSTKIKNLILAGFVALAGAPANAQTSFSEPATVFYGKVIGTGSARPFLIQDGTIDWIITRHDGTDVNLSASLFKLDDGTYSYRMNLPHSALALGLSASVGGIPLPPVPEIHTHKSVSVNGLPAALLGPATSMFSTEQLLRTATYRMDLAIGAAAVDSDGDGIPDWWEDEHGLDKQNPADASAQLTGDGTTALNAYLNGLDPNHDHRRPELITDEVLVYMSGLTAVLLHAADQDSTPAQITYEITSLPNAGALLLRNVNSNPAAPDLALDVGATFTQEDVLKSRLVYRPDLSGSDPGVFGVKVRDEQSATASDEGEVRLLGFNSPDSVSPQATATERQRIANDEFAALGFVVADAGSLPSNTQFSALSAGLSGASLAAFTNSYGQDKSHLLLAGRGNSIRVSGGQAADRLVIGEGRGVLVGGAGADRFVFSDLRTGRLTVEDFSVAQSDVLDFSALPSAVAGRFLHHYLRVTNVAGVHELRVDLDGDGVGFTNLAVSLPGLSATDADLYRLASSGNLDTGALALQPRVSIIASVPGASENGPTAGEFTLQREGSLAGDLTVSLAISGTAENGADYGLIASTIVIPAGQSQVTIPVLPYVDGVTEVNEIATVGITANAAYAIGSSSQASVTISDQMMVVKIEAVDTLAVKDSQIPATFLVSRRDVIDRDVLVRLQITGTAANGIDYNTISTSLLLPKGQSMALVTVTPKATAVLAGGMETVIITIRTDAAYLIESGLNSAQVSIIERQDTFQSWMAREFPGEGDLDPSDAIGSSIPLIQRYAYGLDPDQPDPAGLPKISALADGTMVLSFRKPLGVEDIDYRVSAAGDLMNWGGSSIGVEPVASPAGNTDPQRVFYRLIGVSDAAAAFTVIELDWVE